MSPEIRAGDLVVRLEKYGDLGGNFRGRVVRVTKVRQDGWIDFQHTKGWLPDRFRPATPEEISAATPKEGDLMGANRSHMVHGLSHTEPHEFDDTCPKHPRCSLASPQEWRDHMTQDATPAPEKAPEAGDFVIRIGSALGCLARRISRVIPDGCWAIASGGWVEKRNQQDYRLANPEEIAALPVREGDLTAFTNLASGKEEGGIRIVTAVKGNQVHRGHNRSQSASRYRHATPSEWRAHHAEQGSQPDTLKPIHPRDKALPVDGGSPSLSAERLHSFRADPEHPWIDGNGDVIPAALSGGISAIHEDINTQAQEIERLRKEVDTLCVRMNTRLQEIEGLEHLRKRDNETTAKLSERLSRLADIVTDVQSGSLRMFSEAFEQRQKIRETIKEDAKRDVKPANVLLRNRITKAGPYILVPADLDDQGRFSYYDGTDDGEKQRSTINLWPDTLEPWVEPTRGPSPYVLALILMALFAAAAILVAA